METCPYGAYLLAQTRMADAMREAEHRRLAKSVEEDSDLPGWLQRLGLRLRRQTSVKSSGAVDTRRRRNRQTMPNPTV